jgi:hypothetical protein
MIDNSFSFIMSILPKTKKKFSSQLVKKLKQTQYTEPCSYECICTIAKMWEKEVEIMRLIQRQVSRF